jgi:uncharacterized membrane protein
MTFLVFGLVLFLGIHSVSIFAWQWRDAQVAQRGERVWKGIYAVLSLVGFALLVYGYGQARQSPVLLYTAPTWARHLALLLMVPVFPLLVASSFPGRIKEAARHPLLLATKLDVVLFGAFLAWAVADRISLKRRPARAVPGAPAGPANDAIVIVGGLAIYVVFLLWAHAWLIGVKLIG